MVEAAAQHHGQRDERAARSSGQRHLPRSEAVRRRDAHAARSAYGHVRPRSTHRRREPAGQSCASTGSRCDVASRRTAATNPRASCSERPRRQAPIAVLRRGKSDEPIRGDSAEWGADGDGAEGGERRVGRFTGASESNVGAAGVKVFISPTQAKSIRRSRPHFAFGDDLPKVQIRVLLQLRLSMSWLRRISTA